MSRSDRRPGYAWHTLGGHLDTSASCGETPVPEASNNDADDVRELLSERVLLTRRRTPWRHRGWPLS